MSGLVQSTKPQGLVSKSLPVPSRYGVFQKVGLGGRCRRVCDRRGGGTLRVEAKSKAEEALQGVLQKGNELVDTVAGIVPDSVPRSTARTVTAIVGVALVWFLIQKVVSTLFFFILLGGGAYLYLQSQGGNGDGGGGDSGSSGGGGIDDDPMEAAKKIMDKYK